MCLIYHYRSGHAVCKGSSSKEPLPSNYRQLLAFLLPPFPNVLQLFWVFKERKLKYQFPCWVYLIFKLLKVGEVDLRKTKQHLVSYLELYLLLLRCSKMARSKLSKRGGLLNLLLNISALSDCTSTQEIFHIYPIENQHVEKWYSVWD